ncbi:uncharacterized protein LOC129940976 [Eupeodes corollae]|uniref:uncharacterized protein LOC129940976 n=1 Tax=Eupeodes corollae TaxID=290404 RepID=UPI00248FA1B3|nr:uncharacterized protein LOC129940976 [Eupeodes corollae]
MSCAVDNNAFEMIITPSRKRKRDSGRTELPLENTPPLKTTPHQRSSAFTNAAFSSTPKKEIQSIIQKFNRFPPSKRRPLGKENGIRFATADPCLEVKSISDLVHKNEEPTSGNPFEVIRKPPKKKKKADLEDACFVNTGLNLEIPEKQFNPFEVMRDSPTRLVKSNEPQCFVNPALNIRTQDTTLARNPFEIQRHNPAISENTSDGIENPGLDLANTTLRIGIPFTPTIGCRIDFNNLTPSKMLSEKLVFSPMIGKNRVLTDINEEDTTMDIGKELDLYQLELENSINEAKQRKTTNIDCRTFSEKLEDIKEDSQEEKEEGDVPEQAQGEEPKTPETTNVLENTQSKLRLEAVETPPVQKLSDQDTVPNAAGNVNKTYVKEAAHNESFTDDEGIDYDDTDDDAVVDFKAPAPFVRAYRRPDPIPPSPLSIENHNNELMKEDSKPLTAGSETKSSMKSMIRNSIRKLIHPNKTSIEDKAEKKTHASSENHSSNGHHFMETIRHSLRRKPQKDVIEMPSAEPSVREISIIDTSERKMKLKSNAIHTGYIKMEDLATERKTSLRSSIRKSTRDVKNQIMKSVFHKNNEEYNFS